MAENTINDTTVSYCSAGMPCDNVEPLYSDVDVTADNLPADGVNKQTDLGISAFPPQFWRFLLNLGVKQKTAYEIGVRLVGSEMCIRDRHTGVIDLCLTWYRFRCGCRSE